MILLLFFFFSVISSDLNVNLVPNYGTPPLQRYWSSMTYSPSHNCIVLFGGIDDVNFFNDVWTFDLSSYYWQVLYSTSSTIPGK